MGKVIGFKNFADSIVSFLKNEATSARTYTFQDRDGTVADLQDVQVITTVSIDGAVVLDSTAFGKVHELTDNVGVADYTVTVPDPAGNTGKTLFFKGLPTLTKIVTLSNGAVTFDGEANWKLSKRGLVGLKSNGTNYVIIAEAPSLLTFAPTYVGWATPPTALMYYTRCGAQFTLHCTTAPGTSNSTTTTVTAPFIIVPARWIIRIQNNSTSYASGMALTDGTNLITCYISPAAAAWTASNNKAVEISMCGIIGTV